jgi:hypothetical protein
MALNFKAPFLLEERYAEDRVFEGIIRYVEGF